MWGPDRFLLLQSGDAFLALALLVDFVFLLLLFGGELHAKSEFAELASGDIERAATVFRYGWSESNPDGAPPEGVVAVESGRALDPERGILIREKRDADLDGAVPRFDVEVYGGRLILRFGL